MYTDRWNTTPPPSARSRTPSSIPSRAPSNVPWVWSRVIGLLLAIGIAAPVVHASAQPDAIHVLITNDARLSGWMIKCAEATAARIYRGAGIVVDWENEASTTHREATTGPLMVVALVPPDVTRRMNMGPQVMGFTIRVPSTLGGRALIFVNRVESRARDVDTDTARLLGTVIAHELGHMLLPGPHASIGLMRANWGRDEMRLASMEALRFAPNEVARIHESLKTISAQAAAAHAATHPAAAPDAPR